MANFDLRRACLGTLAAALLVVAQGCGKPAQMGPDKEVFKAVDALYTAVSLRDPKLVQREADRLKALSDAGKIPEAAFGSLDSMIAQAKGGSWEPAQEALAGFMEGQRR